MVAMTEAQKVEWADAEKLAYEAEAKFESVVGRREMRRNGITVLDIRRRARQMTRAGELSLEMTPEQVLNTVLDDICGDNPRIYEAIDWNALLEFLKGLLPLIMQIIALFL